MDNKIEALAYLLLSFFVMVVPILWVLDILHYSTIYGRMILLMTTGMSVKYLFHSWFAFFRK